MTDAVATDEALLSAPDVPTDEVKPAETPTEAAPPDDAASGADAVSPEEPPQFDPRLEIPGTLGPVRRAILDALLDSETPLTVAQLIAQTPAGTPRSVAESSIHRELEAGRIVRVAPGTYRLAPPKPPAPPEPPPPAAVKALSMVAGFAWPAADRGALTEDEWFEALEKWHIDPASWQPIGPPPDQDGSKVPFDIWRRFQGRIRKREERRAEAEAAAARQAAADRELRDKLIAVCHGNFIGGPGLDDVAPIRAALKTVPIDVVLAAIRGKTDRKIFPGNQPAVSWREERLLRAIAEKLCRYTLAPAMVSAWASAGMAPGKPAGASDAVAAVP